MHVQSDLFFEDPLDNFQEIFRVLKPGGKLVVGFRDKAQMKNLPLSADVFNAYTLDEGKLCLLNSSFLNIRIEEYGGEAICFVLCCSHKGIELSVPPFSVTAWGRLSRLVSRSSVVSLAICALLSGERMVSAR